WRSHERGVFAKHHFDINLGRMTITCPAGQVERISFGSTAQFSAETCASCWLRPLCTDSPAGRTVAIAADERMQKKLRLAIVKPEGRKRLRQRVTVEHRLAHHTRKQ